MTVQRELAGINDLLKENTSASLSYAIPGIRSNRKTQFCCITFFCKTLFLFHCDGAIYFNIVLKIVWSLHRGLLFHLEIMLGVLGSPNLTRI